MIKMDKQKEAELTYKAAVLDKRLKYLRNELEKVVLLMTEMEKAKLALKIEKNAELLFPIGAGILGYATLKEKNFIFPIGGGYYIKLDAEETRKKIEENLEKTKQYYETINTEVKKAENELIEIMKEARKLNIGD
jgi:prefoldin alpha subunit